MAILEKGISITLHSHTIKHYENLNYAIPKQISTDGVERVRRGTQINVRVEDLTQSSAVLVTKICDFCLKKIETKYCDIIEGRKIHPNTDLCKECSDNHKIQNFHNKKNELNCIAVVNPFFAELLWNKEDSLKFTQQSNKKIDFKCPTCGEKIKNKRIQDVFKYGLSCSQCSDGISYPEKFISNMLYQLGIDFETQKSFPWASSKKYDFFIPSKNCIIESHGKQHYDYTGFNRSLIDEQENDQLKEIMAKQNGINNYFIINCELSELDFIKKSITENEFSKLICTKNIDWYKCHEYACNSLVKVACDYYNNGITSTSKIGSMMNLNRHTVLRYLKQGNKIGWCAYNLKQSHKNKRGGKQKSVIKLSKNNEFIEEYGSLKEASQNTNGVSISSISSTCNRKLRSAGGYRWMFKIDYEKMINGRL